MRFLSPLFKQTEIKKQKSAESRRVNNENDSCQTREVALVLHITIRPSKQRVEKLNSHEVMSRVSVLQCGIRHKLHSNNVTEKRTTD